MNNAIAELNLLLNAENAIVLASVNRRTSDIRKDVRESLATTKNIEKRTIELRETLNTKILKEHERHSAFERSQRDLSSHLTVTMNRVESLSGASHASLEEVRELILSIFQGCVPGFVNTDRSERKKYEQDNDLAELRSWLEPVEHYEEDYVRKLALRGSVNTCEWALSSSESIGKTISQWLSGVSNQPSIVWLTGSPGQGKSVLAAYLIKACEEKNGECLFFFCRHDDEAKRSIHNILRTIAYSLAVAEKNVRMKYLAQKNQGVSLTNMSPVMLWERLFKNNLTSDLSKTIHWIIDGFDELDEQSRSEFATLLADVAHVNLGFKVLLVSREDRVLEEILEPGENVKVVKLNRKRTNKDIRKFITARVGKKFPALSEEARQRVINALTTKAGALFLWATLALNIVCRKHSEVTLFKALDELPLDSEMKSLYSMILRRLSAECPDPAERDIAKALHTWTLCSSRPLSLSELKCALELKFGSMFSLSEFKRAVRDFGGSLIDIGDDMSVTFVHATVKEFLTSEDAGEFRISEETGNRYISGVCLEYLTGRVGNLERTLHAKEDATPEPERLQSEYVLLQYAAQHLFHHVRSSYTQFSLDFLNEIISFLEGGWCLTWIEALGTFGSIDSLPVAASAIKDVQRTIFCSEKLAGLVAQAAIDLSRIALQIDEKISEHPRSIHVSLSSMFPRQCIIAHSARHDSAKCLYPEFQRWSPIKAYRGSGHDPAEARVALTFTPCGMYLVYAQIQKRPMTVDIVIYQTQTYQPIIKLDPLVNGKAPVAVSVDKVCSGPRGIPVGETFRFFEILCSSGTPFRVLAAYDTERGYLVDNELYLRCILAEHTSESPYQSGKWHRSVPFDFPVSRSSPRVHIAMNPQGQQILAWGNRRVFFWRNIKLPHVTFAFNTPILAVDFISINRKMVIICIVPDGLRIRDVNNFQDLKTVPHNFGRATDVLVDTVTGNVLVTLPGAGNFISIELRVNVNGYYKSLRDPRSEIRCYVGSLRSNTWSYLIWESNRRRLLIKTETERTRTIYPNPTNNESVIPSVERHRFVVIDDLSDPPVTTQFNGQSLAPEQAHRDLLYWRTTVRKQEDPNRFWLHEQHVEFSPCMMYVAFKGCDRWRHPENCEKCKMEPGRVGFGDRSAGSPVIWLPTEHELDVGNGNIDFAFDRYSRLFLFADQGRGIFIYMADLPQTKFRIDRVGLLKIDDVAAPPVIYSQSRMTVLLICYSFQNPMEVWKLEFETQTTNLRRQFVFDTFVIAADMHSSILIFVTNIGWICSVDLNNDLDHICHHFRLPADFLLPDGQGTDSCVLKCTIDGEVTIQDMYGERWRFWIATIAQTLQSVKHY